jgi:hypothetical protein
MRARIRLGTLAAAGVLAVLVALLFGAAILGCTVGGRTVTPDGNSSVAEAKSFRDFDLFYAGESALGHPLTAVTRESIGPTGRGQEAVTFFYGDCELPEGEGGCSLPVSIDNEPACARHLGMYKPELGSPTPNRMRLRGAEAGVLEGGSHIEIQTGTTTVTVFAFSKREALAVARNLRGVNAPVSASDPLPPPAPGALQGKVACPR